MAKVIRRVLTENGMQEIEVNLPDSVPMDEIPVEEEVLVEEVPEVEIVETPEVSDEDILSMSGKELTAMCESLGLAKGGSNSAKISRILEATKSEEDSL